MRLKVAIIDSGVDKEDPLLRGMEIENVYYSNGQYQSCCIRSNNMHGTEVVKVLLHEAPDIELLSVRVLQEDNRCMISAVLNALKYCIEKEVDIINLSLGSCSVGSKHLLEMKQICDEAERKGIAVFAANHNTPGMVAYPANFDNVIGVNTPEGLESYCQVSFKDKLINFSENMVFVPDDVHCVIRKGNSYLCPFIVGLFCQYVDGRDIDIELVEGFMKFLVNFSKTQNIHKIFFDKSKTQELEELNNKKILYFAEEWDYNNQQIFRIYEENTDIQWCFKDIYLKDFSKIEYILDSADVFFIGALGNEFMCQNEKYLHRLIEFLAERGVEILMVFPILNTFGRIHLSKECGNNVRSFYK